LGAGAVPLEEVLSPLEPAAGGAALLAALPGLPGATVGGEEAWGG
jgi:hypothetical protein